MLQLDQTYQVNELQTASEGGAVHIPDGDYLAKITTIDEKVKEATGEKWGIARVQITHGEHQGVVIDHMITVRANEQWKVDNGLAHFADIARSLGMTQLQSDTSVLCNKPLMVKVVAKKGKDWINDQGDTVEGQMRSEIKKYKPAQQAVQSAAQSAPPAASAPPAQSAPATASAPTDNPFA